MGPRQAYTGQRFDAEIGVHYYGARYYDAATGTFLSADVVVARMHDPGGYNRYAYVEGDPLSRTDPSGHFSLGKLFGKVVRAVVRGVAGYATGGAAGAIAGRGLLTRRIQRALWSSEPDPVTHSPHDGCRTCSRSPTPAATG